MMPPLVIDGIEGGCRSEVHNDYRHAMVMCRGHHCHPPVDTECFGFAISVADAAGFPLRTQAGHLCGSAHGQHIFDVSPPFIRPHAAEQNFTRRQHSARVQRPRQRAGIALAETRDIEVPVA